MDLALHSNGISALLLLALLTTALIFDLQQHRVPNWLSVSGLLSGLVIHSMFFGISGLLIAMASAVVGLLAFLPFYAKRAMGAGDVKLMAAVGSLLGIPLIFFAIIATLLFGGAIAVMVLMLMGGSGEFFGRYVLMVKTFTTTGQLIYIDMSPSDPGKKRFPYVTAITAGTVVVMYYSDMLATVINLGVLLT